jgi:hypothetical protein
MQPRDCLHILAACAYDDAMLTKELAIAEYDFHRGRILPDRLTRQSHGQYVDYAKRMLQVYRGGVGRTRRELHRAVYEVFADEEDCPARVCCKHNAWSLATTLIRSSIVKLSSTSATGNCFRSSAHVRKSV